MADDEKLRRSGGGGGGGGGSSGASGSNSNSSSPSSKRGRSGSSKADAAGLVSGLLQALVPEALSSSGSSPRRASMGSSAENRALFKQRNLSSNRSFEALKKKRISSDKPSSAPRLRDLRARGSSNAGVGKFESPDKSGYLIAKEPISLSDTLPTTTTTTTTTTTATTTTTTSTSNTSKVDLTWNRQWFCLKGGTLYQFNSRDVKAQPVREIELHGTAVGEVIVPQHEFCLRIKTQTMLYLFQADSEFEYFTWIIALRGARLFMLYAPSTTSLLGKWNNTVDDDDLMLFDPKTGQLERPDQSTQPIVTTPEQPQPQTTQTLSEDTGSDDDEYEYEEVECDEVDSNASSRSVSPSLEASELVSGAIVVESSISATSSISAASSGYASASSSSAASSTPSSAVSSAASSAASSPALSSKPPRPPRITPVVAESTAASVALQNGIEHGKQTGSSTRARPVIDEPEQRVPVLAIPSLIPLHQSCPDVSEEHEELVVAAALHAKASSSDTTSPPPPTTSPSAMSTASALLPVVRAGSPGFSERGSASTSSVITADERIRMMEQRRLAAEQRRKEAEQRRKEAERRERSMRVHDEFSMLDSRSTPNLKNRFGDATQGGDGGSGMALSSVSTSFLICPADDVTKSVSASISDVSPSSSSSSSSAVHKRSSSSSKLKDASIASSGTEAESSGHQHHSRKKTSSSSSSSALSSSPSTNDHLRDSARDLVDPSNLTKRVSGVRDDRKRSVSMYGSSSQLNKNDSPAGSRAVNLSATDGATASSPSLAVSGSHLTASSSRGSRMIAAGPQALLELKRAQQEASNNATAASVSIVVDETPDAALPRRDSKKLARTGNFRQSLPGALKAQLFPKKEDTQLPRKSGILSLLEKKQKFGVIGGSKKRWVELRDGVLFVTRNATDKPLFVEQVVYCNARVGRSTRGMHTSKKKFCFELITPSCTRVFAADSGAEMLDWITKIQEAQAYFMNIQLGYDVKQEEAFQRKSGINGVIAMKGNSVCADCKSKKDVLWASINLGVFLCIDCAGVHRWLGVDHSQVRSISMDQWRDSVVEFMRDVGNIRANAYWAANVPKALPGDADSATRQAYITDKYVNRLFVDPNGTAPRYKGTPTHSLTHSDESSENASSATAAHSNNNNNNNNATRRSSSSSNSNSNSNSNDV